MDHNTEIEKLKAECQELEEQVCLIVSTEFKLRRTQAELIQSKAKIKEYSKGLELKVEERTKEIEEKNRILIKQTNELNEINTLLEERQQLIEEQSEELKAKADELLMKNYVLTTLNATKDKFFSIIAHDIKNPFTSILGFCQLLLSKYDKYNDVKRKYFIENINQSANNLYKLLENLLQWSRSQTGNIKYDPEKFKIYEIVANIITLMENQMKEKQLLSQIDIPKDFKVFADENMISTVIRNLLSNAIKYTENGEITVQLKEDTDTVTIFVKDTGIGMTEEKASKIFNIGETGSDKGTWGETGTGLGLIICKEFIEKNGGTIGVDSKIGKGTTFFFTLPVKSQE